MSMKLWSFSIGLFTAVVGVVAALLVQIIRAAKDVDDHAADIWTVGKQIAGNTVSIWMLQKANDHLREIGDVATSIDRRAASIDDTLRALIPGK